MIKCSVTINGTISRAAQMRTDKDNNSFVSFPMSVVLPAKSGINKTVEVSVSLNGTQNDCHKYQANQRVEVQGTLTLRKRGDALYFNFMADSVNLNPVETKDKFEGEMEFRGSLGNKDVIVKNDKKGNPFSVFSGFSTEKVGENFDLSGCVSSVSLARKRHSFSQRERSMSKALPSLACTTTKLTSVAVYLKSPSGSRVLTKEVARYSRIQKMSVLSKTLSEK